MQAWQAAEIRPGTEIAVLGYIHEAKKGDAVLRAEYPWVAGKASGLRSWPA